MSNRKPRLLFLSTGDATRSCIAEAFIRSFAGEGIEVASTAVQADAVHPLAPDVMREEGVDISGGASKTIADSLKEPFNCVITISDAAKERHPIWPFAPQLLHWSVADPADVAGSSQQRLEHLRRIRDEIKEQVKKFISTLENPAGGGLTRAARA